MFAPELEGGVHRAGTTCDMRSQMTLTVTLALAAGFLMVALFAGWRGARPPNPLKGPRLMPWRPMMVAAAVGLILMLVHAVNLLGVQTGR